MSELTADSRGIHVPCPSCGKVNRLQYRTLGQPTRCGNCHQPLAGAGGPDSPVSPADETAFNAMASESPLPILVDFWAPWCGPCRSVAPEVATLARVTAGQLLVAKVNTKTLPGVAQAFRIASIPTFVVLKQGREVRRQSGAVPAAVLQRLSLT